MAVNTLPIFPLTPYAASCSLIAASACTSRAPATLANLILTPIFAVALTTAQTNGLRIDRIQVKASATAIGGATTAGTVIIWMSDGTTGWAIDELLVTVVTPSASVASFTTYNTYTNLVIPSTHALYASGTIVGAAAANALIVTAFGGAY